MSVGKRVLASLVFLVMVGSVIASDTPAQATPQGFLTVRGTSIVDPSGQAILLRGINYQGYDHDVGASDGEYPPLHLEGEYQAFAGHGFNVVRLQISWANLEPLPGMFNLDYLLQRVDRDVQWAKQHHIHIIIEMAQQDWATKFNGVGAPEWTVGQYPATVQGMRKAVSNFWVNASLQEHLATTWQKIAKFYANATTIAGYDLWNEPWVYTSVIPGLNSTHIDSFYSRVMTAIRKVDTNHIFFLEPSNMPDLKSSFKERIVWSPHFYALSFNPEYFHENFTILAADLAAKYERYVIEYHSPMWIGEFGGFMNDGSRILWLQDTLRLFDKYQLGWAWFPFSIEHGRSIGDIPSVLSQDPSSLVVDPFQVEPVCSFEFTHTMCRVTLSKPGPS